MPMNPTQLTTIHDRFFGAWNRQDVEALAACYSEDCVYIDPNTRGEVKGRDAFRRYLRKLFAAWQMQWSLKELFPLADVEGAAALWHASIRRPGGQITVEADGMDLILLDGDLVSRNEVYFNREVIGPLLQ